MVEYLTINDIKYPYIVNYYVIGDFQRETGRSFNDLGHFLDNLYLVEPLLFYAIKYGCLISKTEMTLKREDMPLLLADNKVYLDFIASLGRFFPPSGSSETDKKK